MTTTFNDDEVYITENPNWMFLEDEPRECFEKFVKKSKCRKTVNLGGRFGRAYLNLSFGYFDENQAWVGR